jgi:hypothetical protein
MAARREQSAAVGDKEGQEKETRREAEKRRAAQPDKFFFPLLFFREKQKCLTIGFVSPGAREKLSESGGRTWSPLSCPVCHHHLCGGVAMIAVTVKEIKKFLTADILKMIRIHFRNR